MAAASEGENEVTMVEGSGAKISLENMCLRVSHVCNRTLRSPAHDLNLDLGKGVEKDHSIADSFIKKRRGHGQYVPSIDLCILVIRRRQQPHMIRKKNENCIVAEAIVG